MCYHELSSWFVVASIVCVGDLFGPGFTLFVLCVVFCSNYLANEAKALDLCF